MAIGGSGGAARFRTIGTRAGRRISEETGPDPRRSKIGN